MKIKVQVWDEDGRTQHDFVDSLQTSIMTSAAASQSTAEWRRFIIRSRTRSMSVGGMPYRGLSAKCPLPPADSFCFQCTQCSPVHWAEATRTCWDHLPVSSVTVGQACMLLIWHQQETYSQKQNMFNFRRHADDMAINPRIYSVHRSDVVSATEC